VSTVAELPSSRRSPGTEPARKDAFFAGTIGTAIILVLLTAAGALISILKVPVEHHDVVWAEDAGLFLVEAAKTGPWNVIFDGYAGYQHLIPRVATAAILSFVPLSDFAFAVLIVCAVLTGLTAAAVYWLSRDLIPWIPGRLAVACITFLIPSSSQEVVGNLADIHSYCMWLVPWILLSRPRSWAGSAFWAVVAFVCAMTEIQALLFLPLVLLRLHPRHRIVWPVFAAFVAGIAWQGVTAVTEPRPSSPAWPGLAGIMEGYLYNTTLPLLFPRGASAISLIQTSGALIPALLLVPFAVAGVVAFFLGSRWQKIAVITLLVGSTGVYAGGAIVDGSIGVDYENNYGADFFDGFINLRYGVPAGMFLTALVPLAAAVLARRFDVDSRLRGWAVAVALLLVTGMLAVFVYANFRTESSRSAGGNWSEQIDVAAETCAVAPASETVYIYYAPIREIPLTCAQVLEYQP